MGGGEGRRRIVYVACDRVEAAAHNNNLLCAEEGSWIGRCGRREVGLRADGDDCDRVGFVGAEDVQHLFMGRALGGSEKAVPVVGFAQVVGEGGLSRGMMRVREELLPGIFGR